MVNTQLLASTTRGWYLVDLASRRVLTSGLQRQLVSTVAVSSRHILATCPELAEVHQMMSWWDGNTVQECGAWLARLDPNGAAIESECKVWHGNAKTCGMHTVGPDLRLYLGTEPADVLISDDMGSTWRDTDSFRAIPEREKWTFPAKPNLPHTMSIDFGLETGKAAAESATLVMAGVEVGGALIRTSDGSWENRLGPRTTSGAFELCHDVHQLRPDPFNPAKWYAICGATQAQHSQLPDCIGGLFVTHDEGRHWQRLFDGGPFQGSGQSRTQGTRLGYTIGLALNPMQEGELIVSAGDKAPGVGIHIYHSLDGGHTMEDITQAVARSPGVDIGEHAAVPIFVDRWAVLAFDNGMLAINSADCRNTWVLATQLPASVLSLCVDSRPPSSVIH